MPRLGRVNGSALLAVLGSVLLLGGCADVAQERLRYFTEDGNDRFAQGSYDKARKSYEVALQLKPGDGDLLYNIGKCYERLGQADQAEHSYQECLRRDPNHALCRHALIGLMIQQKRLPEAQEAVQSWLASAPKSADPLVEEGVLARQRGDHNYAIACYQKALGCETRNRRAMIELGGIYEERGNPEYALVLYERVLEDNPNQPQLRQHVQDMYARGVGRPRPN